MNSDTLRSIDWLLGFRPSNFYLAAYKKDVIIIQNNENEGKTEIKSNHLLNFPPFTVKVRTVATGLFCTEQCYR